MKPTKEVTGFHFQEIPLEEALNVVLVGNGSYSDVKESLLARLPQLPPDKAFAFGLPNGKEVPEEQRRGLCKEINTTLKRANLVWRVTYSSTKKLFICVPTATPKKSPADGNYVAKSKWNDNSMDGQIWNLYENENLSAREIAEKLKQPYSHVKYICYQKSKEAEPKPANGGVTSLEALENLACKIYKVEPAQLKGGRLKGKELTNVRQAICYVARRKLHLGYEPVRKHFGVALTSLYGINQDAKKIPDTIALLEKAVDHK